MRKYLLCFETNYKNTIKGDEDMNYLLRSEIEEFEKICHYDDEKTSTILCTSYTLNGEGRMCLAIHDDIDNQFLFSLWDPEKDTGNYEQDYKNYSKWLLEKYKSYCEVLEESLRRKHGQIVNISKEITSNLFF